MVSLVCHILNREELERFQRDVSCVPPEILDQLDQFRKDIVAKLIMSKENTLNVEAIKQASNMTLEAITEATEKMGRKPKPSAALKSPFVQVSIAELEKKH
ncbi:hypothetical protein PIB30_054334 [Stylosanthes scabra]|uniref:Uncharacterized protein n=1 Tax=Stylosanthes scabra TaxID=79078 RepID=A0ABU6VJT3_9FABA|nr:hypothetical protein [Stylosanthes scabra]